MNRDADLIATTANEIDQMFRQRHTMQELESLLKRFADKVVRSAVNRTLDQALNSDDGSYKP